MPRVLYLSHATPEVYAIIREAAPAGLQLLTLEKDSDEERRAKIAECEVVIVNRLVANISAPGPDAPSVLDRLGLKPLDPHAKDLSGELKTGRGNERASRSPDLN